MAKKKQTGPSEPESFRTATPVKSYMQEVQARLQHKCDGGWVRKGVQVDGRDLNGAFFSMVPCPTCNPIVRGGAPHTHPPRPRP